MKKTFAQLVSFAAVSLMIMGMMAGCCSLSSNKAASPKDGPTVALREIGLLKVTPRHYGVEPNRSSWITMEAEDERKATVCASKYLEDILGFGEVKSASDPAIPGTLLALDGAGWWVLGLDGAEFHVVFSRSKEELTALLKTANAAKWHAVPRGAYPQWLDFFDNAAMTFWFSGMGALPTDLPGDLQWYADNKFTSCAFTGNTERHLIAPGILDTSIMDWQSAVSSKYHIPYKIMAESCMPMRPECLWNYTPLPHYIPVDGQLAAGRLDFQALAVHGAFQAGAVTDQYLMDFRRRVSEHLKDDPYFIGHHAMQEMTTAAGPCDLASLASVAGTPAIQELWRTFLRDTLKYDLKQVGAKHYGDANAFRRWSDVQIPSLKEFIGWDSSVIDLKGMWQGRADRDKKAEQEKWFEDNASDQWRPVDCQDLGIMLFCAYRQRNSCDYYLRRKFTMTSANSSARFFHMARTGVWYDTPPEYDVWINGQKLKVINSTDPSCVEWDRCYDAGPALKPGENIIVINTKGIPLASYAFISAKGRWVYPSSSETLNRRYFDALAFEEWLNMRELENRMIAIRAGEPNRPIKIMAPGQYIDRVLELCAQYGAYPHNTGGAEGWWQPFGYSRYAFTCGVPNSAEESVVPANAAVWQGNLTRYLMMGVETIDNVCHPSFFSTNNAGIKDWITANRELLRCFGKQDLVQPAVGILRYGRELRLGHPDIYTWDMGRGALPAIGRAFNYATLGDVKSGRANKFRVLLDCATSILAQDEVDAIERYVRQGGIFVAIHNTGMHTPEKAYAWPIARLTGLRVLNENQPIGGANIPYGGTLVAGAWETIIVSPAGGAKIHFSDTQGLWPKLRGQEMIGGGLVLDWLKQDRTGTPIALAAQAKDIEVVAEWKDVKMDGAIAVAIRTLGKGKVITLGSTFYRNGKDEAGRYVEPGTLPYLDEMLTSLGVPRETFAGELWSEHWRSKNGVYDVYPIAQMNEKAAPVSIDVKIRRDTPIASLWELSALRHPVQPVSYADGMFTIPQVKMEAMQTRVFAAPSKDIANAALHWLEMQKRQWGKLPEISAADKKRATVEPAADVIPLIEGWQCSSGEKDPAWVKPADTSAKEWKSVKLGSFAAMGLPEDAIAQFRKEVRLPKDWNGQRVTLVFNTEDWYWGIGLRGRLWINGEPAAIKQPLQPEPDGSFAIELTPAQCAQQPLVMALEVDGRPTDKKQGNPRPTGVTGSFLLRVAPQPAQVTALTKWAFATDLNHLTPTAVGQNVEGMYLETEFSLPAKWPAKRLYVQSPAGLGSLFINNQYIAAPKWMNDLDISGLVKREGVNVLRRIPVKPFTWYTEPYKGKVPELNLLWTE